MRKVGFGGRTERGRGERGGRGWREGIGGFSQMRLRQGRCGGCGLDRLGWDEALGGGVIGPRQDVEHLVGAAVDEVEPIQSERGPGTVADQPFETSAVGGLDADAPIQTATRRRDPR